MVYQDRANLPEPFTSASLLKALADQGIGRPSTYAELVNDLEVCI